MKKFHSLLCGLAAAAVPLSAAETKPNIVLILADDMGFSDLSCTGGEIPTPNIDRLANQGMLFTHFSNAARCVPTRASLLTGNYNHAVGCGGMEGPGNPYKEDGTRASPRINHYSGAILREAPTLAEALKADGYQTYLAGKWHMGERPSQRPWERGFDRFYGFLKGAVPNNFDGRHMWDQDRELPRPVPEGWYVENAIADHAIRFIKERDPSKPFFLFYSSSAPHWPFAAPEQDVAPFKGKYDAGYDALREQRFRRAKELGVIPGNSTLPPRDNLIPAWNDIPENRRPQQAAVMEQYAGRMKNLDDNLGRLFAALEEQGVMDNSIIMFLSDNGAEKSGHKAGADKFDIFYPWQVLSNAPFRYHKHMAHEGGVATPLLVRWPGKVPAGQVNHAQEGHVKDLMPTLLEAANAPFPKKNLGLDTLPMAGISLLPAWKDPQKRVDNLIFWEHLGNEGVREGPWKLVRKFNDNRQGTPPWEGPRTGEWELFNLHEDRTESNNLAEKMPAKRDELIAKFMAWGPAVGMVDFESRRGDRPAQKTASPEEP